MRLARLVKPVRPLREALQAQPPRVLTQKLQGFVLLPLPRRSPTVLLRR